MTSFNHVIVSLKVKAACLKLKAKQIKYERKHKRKLSALIFSLSA